MVKYIFSIVHYGSPKRLQRFFEQNKWWFEDDFEHVIVRDNFSNEENLNKIKLLQKKYDFVLCESANIGYGAGHNENLDFVRSKGVFFDYFIVSNYDILLINYELEDLNLCKIYAPRLHSTSGKLQNPLSKKRPPLTSLVCYALALKTSSSFFLKLATVFLKFKNLLPAMHGVYAAHGANIIMGRKALDLLNLPFDPKMFLYCEEIYLAEKARKAGIMIELEESLSVFHDDVPYSMVRMKKDDDFFKFWLQSYEQFAKTNGLF